MEPEWEELKKDWSPAIIKPGKPYSVFHLMRDIITFLLLAFVWFLVLLGFQHYDLVKINEVNHITSK